MSSLMSLLEKAIFVSSNLTGIQKLVSECVTHWCDFMVS